MTEKPSRLQELMAQLSDQMREAIEALLRSFCDPLSKLYELMESSVVSFFPSDKEIQRRFLTTKFSDKKETFQKPWYQSNGLIRDRRNMPRKFI